tara:strand:- start:1016 stop:1918 length:903 start_codon:yes stop_codon:yes gene_type:complete
MSNEILISKLKNLSDDDLNFLFVRITMNSGAHPLESPLQSNEAKINHILHIRPTNMAQETVVDNILNQRDNSKIPKEHLDWIDPDNHRQCIYIWLFINNLYRPAESAQTDMWGNTMTVYQEHYLALNPISASNCYDLSVHFFYIWNTGLNDKINWLSSIKQSWEGHMQFSHKMLKFIEKDNDDISIWLLNYLFQRYDSLPKNVSPIETFKEKLNLVQATIDQWSIFPAEKTIALNKAYTAAHGKKFKSKPKHLKGANFWLGAEQVRMLTEIADKKKIAQKDVLNSLINEKYIQVANLTKE